MPKSDNEQPPASAEGREKAEDEFRRVYRLFGRYIYGVIYRSVPSQAEDLTQEVFLAFLKTVRAGRRDSTLFARFVLADRLTGRRDSTLSFLLGIARNKVNDELREQYKRAKQLELLSYATGRSASNADTLLILNEAISRLDNDVQTIIKLTQEGRTIAEISRASNTPEGTIKTILFRARQHLRDIIFKPKRCGERT